MTFIMFAYHICVIRCMLSYILKVTKYDFISLSRMSLTFVLFIEDKRGYMQKKQEIYMSRRQYNNA